MVGALFISDWFLFQASLFRFDASIHALSTNSYIEDTRQFEVSQFRGKEYLGLKMPN